MEAVSIIAAAPLVHDGWSLAAFVVALVFVFLKSSKFGSDKMGMDAKPTPRLTGSGRTGSGKPAWERAGLSGQHPRKRHEQP